jgi:hypothetical protein
MYRRTIAFALSLLAVLAFSHRDAVGDQVTTPLQTESISMTSTDWGPGTAGITDPLPFAQFNPSLGTLVSVEITLTTTVRNDFTLNFPATLTPTTLYLATTATTDPSVLSNPTLVRQLTDGPTITLLGPDGTTSIFGAPGTTLPVDVVTLTEASGTYSSSLPVTSPNYIAPSIVTLSLSTTLSASNAASLLAEFIGTGTVGLPVLDVAESSFYSSSGNGSGTILTTASATATVQYVYTPAVGPTPEPSGLILLGLGAGIGLVATVRGRRAARPAGRDRD